MNIGLIATDVDGTLVADDHLIIPPINVDALRMAKNNGIKIAISTGRTYSLTDKEAEALDCVDYLILSNGAAIVDGQTLEVIYSCYLPLEPLEKIANILEKYPLVYEIYADCQGYITQYAYDHYLEIKGLPQVFLEKYRKRMTLCDGLWDMVHTKNIEKINIDYLPKEYIKPLMQELNGISGLVFSEGYEGNVEISTEGADKGKALAWLAEHIGVKPENVMAFGDSGNDVTMLQYAGCSYAMASGKQTAKDSAKYITKSGNNEGGVGETIKEYLKMI